MAVASAAKIVLLPVSLLGRWRQVVSSFWKWWLINAARSVLRHSCRFHRLILEFHYVHWTQPGFLVQSSYICSLLQWGCHPLGRNRAFLVESWASSRGRTIWHWSLQRPWLSLPWNQWEGLGSGHASSPIWSGDIYISSGSIKFMQGMICWIVSAGTNFQIVMHG